MTKILQIVRQTHNSENKWPKFPRAENYPKRGIEISHHQNVS